jgi:hypothetical protein
MTIALSNVEVPVGSPPDTVVGALFVVGAGATSTPKFAITDDTPSLFTLSGANLVVGGTPISVAGYYAVDITALDASGDTVLDRGDFVINVYAVPAAAAG